MVLSSASKPSVGDMATPVDNMHTNRCCVGLRQVGICRTRWGGKIALTVQKLRGQVGQDGQESVPGSRGVVSRDVRQTHVIFHHRTERCIASRIAVQNFDGRALVHDPDAGRNATCGGNWAGCTDRCHRIVCQRWGRQRDTVYLLLQLGHL